jgi:hypothetical protein
MILVTDDRNASDTCRWHIEDPTPRNIARLLRRLDARQHTVVALRADEDRQLVIRGGAGRYAICLRDGPQCFFDLVGESSLASRSATIKIAASCEGLRSETILDAETALTCALTYLYTSQRDPRFIWREASGS